MIFFHEILIPFRRKYCGASVCFCTNRVKSIAPLGFSMNSEVVSILLELSGSDNSFCC